MNRVPLCGETVKRRGSPATRRADVPRGLQVQPERHGRGSGNEGYVWRRQQRIAMQRGQGLSIRTAPARWTGPLHDQPGVAAQRAAARPWPLTQDRPCSQESGCHQSRDRLCSSDTSREDVGFHGADVEALRGLMGPDNAVCSAVANVSTSGVEAVSAVTVTCRSPL